MPFSAARTLFAAGLLAGVLDLAYVIVFYGVKAVAAGTASFGQVAARITKSIAAGLFGAKAAQAGGAEMIALGVVLHFTIALGAAAAFCGASRWLRFLASARWWWLAGLGYGVVVWLFMQLVVLPLSAVPPKSFPPPQWGPVFIAHLLCVGLPIAWVARRAQRA